MHNKIRIITATSLFDGHDASINIMRRIIQANGCEVVHLGHDCSVEQVVNCAIQEDAQAIAVTSYQGGHNEYLKYMHDLLHEKGASHIKIFAGGGGVILPHEIADLMQYGISKIYTPDDGRKMGLEGMVQDLIQQADFSLDTSLSEGDLQNLNFNHPATIARFITAAENDSDPSNALDMIKEKTKNLKIPVLGITGTGGAGKSSLTDELIKRIRFHFPTYKIAVLSIDPSKRKTGGALLGDRIRMNSIHHPHIYMRSMATRAHNASVSPHTYTAINILKYTKPNLVIIETSGIGQSGSEITDIADISLYVMTPEFGAPTQLEKIDMLDYADLVAVNKFDKTGALDALMAIKKQYQRNHALFDQPIDKIPVYGTRASLFNDNGVNELFTALMEQMKEKDFNDFVTTLHLEPSIPLKKVDYIIPPARVRYLSEIVTHNKSYYQWVEEQASTAAQVQALEQVKALLPEKDTGNMIQQKIEQKWGELTLENKNILERWTEIKQEYKEPLYKYTVRDKMIEVPTHHTSLSGLEIPKVSLPHYSSWSDILKWNLAEGLPGQFPYTSGIYPFKRTEEDPTRMFAGEGGPERTNKRFHYLSANMAAKRLSTAFDSVTLYGENPSTKPDVYGKIGNSGVSIATLDDMKKLYSGFDLSHPSTSVSMTINGPAPIMLAFFFHTAIDQACEKYIKEHHLEYKVEELLKAKFDDTGLQRPQYAGALPKGNDGLGLMLLGITGDEILPADVYNKIKAETISKVRGTVQADILKEDQAQNTCIFSTEFSLKLMGDVQQYFIDKHVKNFYSVSISGYHMAEAGANPITQLAFTLANGFTYIEYYLSRGMKIDEFAPNFSFFFSNGIDPEYSVIGRVARRIWALAMKYVYKGNSRSQMLKYHIQTSGRSLHAQEIAFNDIRTTLQALYAIYDNCNSLHTNAADEAITTPTEESVRRAVAIQLIINKELGLTKNENPLQGSFVIDTLTNLVEEAVYDEFERITERGGVLGAMESMYQRLKIQQESMEYEAKKQDGTLPIVGVNMFLDSQGSPTIIPKEVIRSTDDDKNNQINNLNLFTLSNKKNATRCLDSLKKEALTGDNLFETLMESVKYCSLGEITHQLFEVGGKYRKSL